ncbi:MAG: hypothetical protein U9R08_00400 [Nanoarchaeota archaeon]|nr:hypothetical protein [Nanoarchaeota archaeon]
MNEDNNERPVASESVVFKEEPKFEFSKKEESKEAKNYNEKTKKGSTSLWAIVGILVIALALSIFTSGFRDWGFGSDSPTSAVVAVDAIEAGDLTFTILNDAECTECDTQNVKQVTEQLFPEVKIIEVEYDSDEGREIYDKYQLQYLPAYLFSADVEQHASYQQVGPALISVEDKFLINPQSSGSTYDPNGEKCENGVDDNDDGLVDCDDPDCEGKLVCMEKKNVPEVEAFVMSHCPFGTQIEKGLLPVVEELGSDIDFKLRFVHYAMHAETEVYEQLNQYCIQKDQEKKLIPYLECFLEEGKGEDCLEEVNIDADLLDECVEETDEEFSITANLEDESTWLGQFPPFNVDKDLTDKYGVQGSPTLVVNGIVVETGRDAASLMNAICYGFKDKPEACDADMSSTSPAPGFGFEAASTGAAASDATCG